MLNYRVNPSDAPMWHLFVFGEALSPQKYQRKQLQTNTNFIIQTLQSVAKGRVKNKNIDNSRLAG